MQAGLRAISGTSTGSYANEAERLTGKALERLRYDTIDEIFKQGPARLPERAAADVRPDRRGHRPNLLLLRGGGMNRYHLVHVTEFSYDGPVSESYNEVRLRPIHDERQSCLSFRLTTNPASRGTAYRDALWQLGAPIQHSCGAPPPEGRSRIASCSRTTRRRSRRSKPLSPNWIRSGRNWTRIF